MEQNVASEKETKENKPATNKVSVAAVCNFNVFSGSLAESSAVLAL